MNGVLPVDKPQGPTSHDAVAAVRRALRIRQVGHTGTLDPFATGLLLICVGPSTRLAEYLTALPKEYEATLRLGSATDTDDCTGAVVSESAAWADVADGDVRTALERQVGEILQLPPRYSAKRVDGERMYAVARRGGEVERKPASVKVHRIDILSIDLPEVRFRVECSSGTYIRSIGRDVGETLGVGGHLTALRRTRVGTASVDSALSFAELADAELVLDRLLAPAEAVAHLPRVAVDDAGVVALSYGQALTASEDAPAGPLALVSAAGDLLAIGERHGALIKPRKVFL